jgi:hypothetical protein
MPPAAPPRSCIVTGHSSMAGPQFGAAACRLNIRLLPTVALDQAYQTCQTCRSWALPGWLA